MDQTPPAAREAERATRLRLQVITEQGPDQWLASKFKGTDVIGPNNEKIGDVNDMLFDKNGKVLAYVVGVGGFLGIGEKDVALALSAFQIVPDRARGEAQARDDQGRVEERGRVQAAQGSNANHRPGAARSGAGDTPDHSQVRVCGSVLSACAFRAVGSCRPGGGGPGWLAGIRAAACV